MKPLDVVAHARALCAEAPYAVVGGLAQMLWARKTHTDDLDVALAAPALGAALARVRSGDAGPEWAIPTPPDLDYEANEVFEVAHVHFRGVVVDFLTFRAADFTDEIAGSAVTVKELGDIRFVRPELLLVRHLLRPGPAGVGAGIDLLLARDASGGLDLVYAERWAERVGRGQRFRDWVARASELGRL